VSVRPQSAAPNPKPRRSAATACPIARNITQRTCDSSKQPALLLPRHVPWQVPPPAISQLQYPQSILHGTPEHVHITNYCCSAVMNRTAVAYFADVSEFISFKDRLRYLNGGHGVVLWVSENNRKLWSYRTILLLYCGLIGPSWGQHSEIWGIVSAYHVLWDRILLTGCT